jgi:PPOX class probable F420-dependent enzyme
MGRERIRMTDSEAAAFLDEARTIQVATMRADGSIHLVAMWYAPYERGVAFTTYRTSQKVRNIERDPRMSVLVEAGASYDELHGVQCSGRARLVTDPDETTAIATTLASRYGQSTEPRDIGRGMAKRIAVVFEPARTVSWDHRKLGARV